MSKIVVITPVRNEAWIIRRFVETVAQFADAIILADQQSTDATRSIAGTVSKVQIVDNPNPAYDEASRQTVLLESARRLEGAGNLLIALDADELPTADSLLRERWERLRQLPPGSVLKFRKHEVLPESLNLDPETVWFPLGLVDDGRPPRGSLIHSLRLPVTTEDAEHRVDSVQFLHLARARRHEFQARQYHYCMVETLSGTKSWYHRGLYYSPILNRRRFRMAGVPVPPEWLDYPGQGRLPLASLPSSRYNHFHARCLDLFGTHGWKRFIWDDVWHEDWNTAARELGHSVRLGSRPYAYPFRFARSLAFGAFARALDLRTRATGAPRGFIACNFRK